MRGEVDLLYVTPERFRSPDFEQALAGLRVTRMAVDEAHCISQWARLPARLLAAGRVPPQAGGPPTIALTATATPRVAEDIVRLWACATRW